MTRYCAAFLLCTFCITPALSQIKVPVFISGEEGHKMFRIPAIIILKSDDLLAFAEGRVQGGSDFGDINLVMKRSSDKGKTWSALIDLVDNDSLQAGNPAPVVDLLDPFRMLRVRFAAPIYSNLNDSMGSSLEALCAG